MSVIIKIGEIEPGFASWNARIGLLAERLMNRRLQLRGPPIQHRSRILIILYHAQAPGDFLVMVYPEIN